MNETKNPYDVLLDPIRLGPVTAPNRFYAVPHATGHSHMEPNGSIGLREMKARGGWGVVSMSITEISADSDLASHPMQRLWDDSDLPLLDVDELAAALLPASCLAAATAVR